MSHFPIPRADELGPMTPAAAPVVAALDRATGLVELEVAVCDRCRKTADGRGEADARAALVARGCAHEPRLRPVVLAASSRGLGMGR